MTKTAGDSMSPDRYTVEELRAAALRGTGALSRPLAVALLARKEYRSKTRDMKALLLDDDEEPRLRALAATALGRIATPAAKKALEAGLEIDDDVALRGVLQGLTLAGREAEREAMRPLARRRGAVGTEVKMTSRLLEHRLRLAGTGYGPQEKLLRVSRKYAEEIEVRTAPRKRVETAIEAIGVAEPALRLAPSGALTMRCVDRDLLFVPTADLLEGGVDRLADDKSQAGVLLGRQEREGQGWEVKHHILTEPEQRGDVRIVVTSSRGRVLYAGTAVLYDDGSAVFHVRTVDQPGVVAVDIRGTWKKGRVRIETARSDARRRRRSPEPKPLE